MRGRIMDNTAKLLRQVRMVGRYDWLGGYTHAVLMDDGETIGPECVRPNYREISKSTRHKSADGWQAVAVFALDDPAAGERCAHCGKALS
jgi:hypothetical protein